MSPSKRARGSAGRIGLALAGGGPGGAVYEIGALRALDEALESIDLNDAPIYVGVSAGSFVAACLANRITPTQLVRAIVKQGPGEHPFHPETFFTPAVGEYIRRGIMVPKLALQALRDYLSHPEDVSLAESFATLSRALPVNIFNNEPIRRYLEEIFTLKGRTDDFRKLPRKLFVIAADLGSGEAVRFGEPGWDHVPISTAVQASTAMPGIYPPVEIDGRHYVDGVLLKTLHASVALDERAKLLVCINPIVPVDTRAAERSGEMSNGVLIDRGLPSVLSQTFRTLIHSRLRLGFKAYEEKYPDADVVLLEPHGDDYLMFFTNIFSFSTRKAVCEHAYDETRKELLRRREELEPIFARHGVRMRIDVLEDPTRNLWRGVGLGDFRLRAPVAVELDAVLNRLERWVRAESRGEEAASPPGAKRSRRAAGGVRRR